MFRDLGECGVELGYFCFECQRGGGRRGGRKGEEVVEDAGCGIDEFVPWSAGLEFPGRGVGGIGVREEVVR